MSREKIETNKKLLCTVLVSIFLVSTALLFTTDKVKTESLAVVCVDPPVVSASSGENFTVDIKVADVKNLYTYQFRLSWEPSLLDVTDVTEGPFLNAEETYRTSFTPRIYNTPDPLGVSGYVYVACTLLGEPATAAASGNGTLATIEFLAKEEGNTSLHLYEEMPHGTEDGYSTIIPEIPSLFIPSLFMIATLLAIVVYRRKHL